MQGTMMMLIYNGGFFAVFLLFFLLYNRAYRKKESLQLNDLEMHDTRYKMGECVVQMSATLLSTSIVLTGGPRYAFWAGISYFRLGL